MPNLNIKMGPIARQIFQILEINGIVTLNKPKNINQGKVFYFFFADNRLNVFFFVNFTQY